MIVALFSVGYFLMGLASARAFFSYRVRTGQYETSFDTEETHIVMALTAIGWPVTAALFGIFGIGRLLRYNPPESRYERMKRKEKEKQAQELEKREFQQRIHLLEVDLGIAEHSEPRCRECLDYKMVERSTRVRDWWA